MSTTLNYSVIRNKPVADFRYKGSHRKPVRRRVVITDITSSHFTGYEVREGNETRDLDDAEIKTFDRTKVQEMTRLSLSDAEISID